MIISINGLWLLLICFAQSEQVSVKVTKVKYTSNLNGPKTWSIILTYGDESKRRGRRSIEQIIRILKSGNNIKRTGKVFQFYQFFISDHVSLLLSI